MKSKLSIVRWLVIAAFVLIIVPFALWRIFLYTTFAPNTSRATRGVEVFQAYLDKGGPIPATQPNGSGRIWSENGLTFYSLGPGAGIGLYLDVLCKSPEPVKLGTPTCMGVVASCRLMSNDIYWLVLKS